ncbi:MAG: hypothetical protein WB716_05995 [Candidatus Acidiferrales bacterium]
MSTAAIVGATVGSSVIGAVGASSAAGAQASAAKNAAQLQYQSGQNALAFDQAVFNAQQANEAPFLEEGQGAATELGNALGITPAAAPQPLNVPGLPASNAVPGASGAPATTPSANPPPNNPFANGGSVSPQPVIGQVGPPGEGLNQPGGYYPAQVGTGFGQIANGGSVSPQPALGFGQTLGFGRTSANNPNMPTNVGGINYDFPTGGGTGTGDLLQPWTNQFQAPTAESAQNTPGYQFELQQGENALQNSAAAQGNLLTGGQEKALDAYANNMASTNYQQVYNNALTQYQQAYNQFQNNQSNTYNRLANEAGMGQVSASNLNQNAAQAGSNVGNTLSTTAGQVGQQLNNAGTATASGYAGIANAATSGLTGLSQLLSALYSNNATL